MHPNPQANEYKESPSRLKSLGFEKSEKEKGSPAKTPRDKSQDGHEHKDEHAEAHAQHGPVVHAHLESNHETGEHQVHIEHADGHKRSSIHDSASEGLEHVSAAHAPAEQGEGEASAPPTEDSSY
jgi:hypothetical protein